MASTTITMRRGDTLQIGFAVTQDGAVLNLTGASVRFTVKKDPADVDNDKLFAKTVGSGITVTSASTGVGNVVISPSDTSGLAAHQHDLYYDLQVTTSGGLIYTVAAGRLVVLPDVSITSP